LVRAKRRAGGVSARRPDAIDLPISSQRSPALPRLVGSIAVGGPLVVCVNIGSLLRDVRLAILSIGKRAATNLAAFAHCVPAVFYASPIGFCFLNVMRR